MPSRRPLLVPFALALAAGLAPAQQAPPPRPPGEAPPTVPQAPEGQHTVASVGGQLVTSNDVTYQLMLVTRGRPAEPGMEAGIVRLIAEQILLAGEAKRLGLDLTTTQVDQYWKLRFGEAPDYEAGAAAAGTTVALQKELAERIVLAEIYLLNKVGLRSDPGVRIPPDLTLEQMVSVTPQQLRDYFHEFRSQLDQPAGVAYALYPCSHAAAAEAIARSLRDGTPVESRPVRESAPLDVLEEVFPYSPELVTFAREAPVGAVSDPVFVQDVALVVQITERIPPKPADFDAVQEELRNRIQGKLLADARAVLVSELARNTVYWPSNLFADPPARESQSGSQPGAGAASGAGSAKPAGPPADRP